MRRSLVVAVTLLAGCIGYHHREPAGIEWPVALLGQWREGGTDPRDTMVLTVAGRGFLDVQRLRSRAENGRTVNHVWAHERMRWWTEPLGPGDAAGTRQFCFTSRPGRGHSCVSYLVAVHAQPDGVALRTLTLGHLAGQSPAVLVAR